MKRPGRWGLLLAPAAALLLTLPARSDSPPGAVEVTASALNVRAGPGVGSARIGLVRRGQVYPELERRGSWVKIQLDERQGWCHGSYLRRSAQPVRTTTASRLNVRTGPSTRYRILGRVPRGTRVAVVDARDAWRKIAFGGRDAWVHGSYLSSGALPPPTTSPPTSSAGFIQLPASGPGFFSYYSADRRWGTPRLVYGIERIGRRWAQEHPGAPRFGVGDLSLRNGGPMSGHRSHRYGVDVDLRPVRNDGQEGRVTIHQAAYSRALTQHLIDLFVDELDVTHIFFNDSRTRHTSRWPNHDNHLHVRIRR